MEKLNKNVPKLRFKEFNGEWKHYYFKDKLDIIDGDRGKNYPKTTDFMDTGYCIFLNAKNVTKNGFNFSSKHFISKEKDELLNKGKLKRLDVVLTTRGSIGNIAFFSKAIKYEHLRINSGMVILRVNNDYISSNFLKHFCLAEITQNYIKSISFGNAQQQLTVSEIKKIPFYTN